MKLHRRLALAALAAALFAPSAMAQLQSYVRETHGSWEIRCDSTTGQCFMAHAHLNEQGQPDVVMSIAKPPGATDPAGQPVTALVEVAVPLDVFLPAGLIVTVDANEGRRAEYERCIARGCVVRAPVSEDMLNEFRRGYTATIRVMVTPERPVEVPVPLNGFTAAYNAL